MAADTDLNAEDAEDYFSPDSVPEDITVEIPSLLDAPDFSTFVKRTRTRKAREYELRVQSALKTVTIGALRNKQLADSAALLDKGPAVAATLGDLADTDERVAKAIDMITAPDNPYIAAAIAGLGLVAQLYRNHEPEIQQLPGIVKESRAERKMRRAAEKQTPPRGVQVKLPFIRKTVTLGLRVRFRGLSKLGVALRMQSSDPQILVNKVFSDEKLIKALAKEGIRFGAAGQE